MDETNLCHTSSESNPPVVAVTWPTFDTSTLLSEGERFASHGGSGAFEIVEITQILEDAGIICCAVGVSALRYYGAARIRTDSCWGICVPTDKLDVASSLLQSTKYIDKFEVTEPPRVYILSLLHTFPRFKYKGVRLWFQLIPSEDCHFQCVPTNIERSRMNIPYPKLEVLAQSLLDMDDRVDLTDLVDGMDLSQEWGEKHLDLDGTNDVEWAERKNEAIRASVPLTENSCLLELPAAPFKRRDTWNEIASTKVRRMTPKYSPEIYATRFRTRGSPDPRLTGMI